MLFIEVRRFSFNVKMPVSIEIANSLSIVGLFTIRFNFKSALQESIHCRTSLNLTRLMVDNKVDELVLDQEHSNLG